MMRRSEVKTFDNQSENVGVWVLQNQRLPTGSVSVPNHQLDKAGYKSYSHSERKGTTTVSVTETEKSIPAKCRCSHPEFGHELDAADRMCLTIGCYCWSFEAVSKVV